MNRLIDAFPPAAPDVPQDAALSRALQPDLALTEDDRVPAGYRDPDPEHAAGVPAPERRTEPDADAPVSAAVWPAAPPAARWRRAGAWTLVLCASAAAATWGWVHWRQPVASGSRAGAVIPAPHGTPPAPAARAADTSRMRENADVTPAAPPSSAVVGKRGDGRAARASAPARPDAKTAVSSDATQTGKPGPATAEAVDAMQGRQVENEPDGGHGDVPTPERLVVSAEARPGHPTAVQAWEKLRQGATAEAASLYDAVLRNDPRNVDARLGLAAIAMQRGDGGVAMQHFTEVLKIEPRQANARAGLLGLAAVEDPQQTELLLLRALARDPAASIYFALGNLHAAQGSWARAQDAYFHAHRVEGSNPDYAYNLAVALDHLGRRAEALRFYRLARTHENSTQAGFDRAQVDRRIAELSPADDAR